MKLHEMIHSVTSHDGSFKPRYQIKKNVKISFHMFKNDLYNHDTVLLRLLIWDTAPARMLEILQWQWTFSSQSCDQ